MIDTAGEGAEAGVIKPDQILMVGGKSLVVLRAHSTPEIEPDHSVAASLAALTHTSTPETASITAPAVTSLPFDYKGSEAEGSEAEGSEAENSEAEGNENEGETKETEA
jgi:glycogen operon protein